MNILEDLSRSNLPIKTFAKYLEIDIRQLESFLVNGDTLTEESYRGLRYNLFVNYLTNEYINQIRIFLLSNYLEETTYTNITLATNINFLGYTFTIKVLISALERLKTTKYDNNGKVVGDYIKIIPHKFNIIEYKVCTIGYSDGGIIIDSGNIIDRIRKNIYNTTLI